MPTEIDIRPLSLKIIEDAQRDMAEHAAYVARMVAPQLAFIAQVQETHRRMAEALTPMLASFAHIQSAISAAAESYRSMRLMVVSPITVSAFVIEPEVIPAPIHRPAKVLPTRKSTDISHDARWEEVELRIKNPHTVAVFHNAYHVRDYDYAELGFARANTRDGKPDKQWGLLLKFALVLENVRLIKPTTDMLARDLGVSKAALQKIKQALATKLSASLGITGDPFYRYHPIDGYRPRFKLKPEALLRGDGELHRSGSRYLDEITSDDEY